MAGREQAGARKGRWKFPCPGRSQPCLGQALCSSLPVPGGDWSSCIPLRPAQGPAQEGAAGGTPGTHSPHVWQKGGTPAHLIVTVLAGNLLIFEMNKRLELQGRDNTKG